MGAPSGAAAEGGLRESARHLLGSVVDLGRTRLELATVEIEEERLRLARMMVGAVVALFLLFVAVVLAVAWIVLLFDAGQRTAALGVLCVAFLVAAALAGRHWQRLGRERQGLLHATLEGLRQDGAALAQPKAPP